MTKLSKTIFVWLAAISVVACTGKKQNSENSATTADSTKVINYAGNYECVMPAADCPGIYTVLSLNENGEYEMYQKYLERVGSFVTKGKFEVKGDSIKLLEEYGYVLKVAENKLILQDITLNKCSDEQQLPVECRFSTMKEDKGGANIDVAIYTIGNDEFAEFTFEGTNYKLKADRNNTQESIFTDSTSTLAWNIIDPAPLVDYKPQLTLKDKKYSFTMLNPVNYLYVAKDKAASITGLDVLYLNGKDDKRLVKLLGSSTIYTLPQVEASSKTAIYEKDSIVWDVRNNRTAVLDVKGKKSEYAEKNLGK